MTDAPTSLDALGIEPSVLVYGRPLYSAASLAPLLAKARRVEELEAALSGMIYETTSLSPMEVDGSHWCRITAATLATARAALKENTDG